VAADLKGNKEVQNMKVIAISVGLSALLLCGTALADVVRVPEDYPTIQEGIDAASYGDEVRVGPGIYRDTNLYLVYDDDWEVLPVVANLKDGVSLVSSAGASQTRIVGSLRTPMIGIYGDSLSSDVRIAGFTIATCGNAVMLYSSGEVTVENCWIDTTTNTGVKCRNASPIVRGNVILNCGNDGVSPRNWSNPIITGNVIGWSGDDGIEVDSPAVPEIIGNTIVCNGTTPSNPSQGIDTGGQDLLIERNIIAWNEAAFAAESGCTIIQNDIFGNGGTNVWGGNISADPDFCVAVEDLTFQVTEESPCAPYNNPWGVQIGAVSIGCTSPVTDATWGAIKAMFR
jgi:hypothetical protein